MEKMIIGNSMWHLVMQSDAVSKGVLIILLIMSIASWALFLYKLIMIRIKISQLRMAQKEIKKITSLEQLLMLGIKDSGTLPGYLLQRNNSMLKKIVDKRAFGGALNAFNEQDVQLIQQQVDQTIDELVHHEESGISLISTSAAVAPLLGLFGTVWGLVHAFIRISEQQSADIATVAPGIAEALITTLAGLMVAIPAVAMFNYLAARVRSFEQRVVALSDSYMTLIQTFFIA